MIIETNNEIIIKIYEFYKFLKYYNKYLNEWSNKYDLDNLEKSYKILINDCNGKYKLNCVKGWSQKNIFNANEYILKSINVELYDEYKKRYKIVNNITINVEHYNIVYFDNLLCRDNYKLCLNKNIFKSYILFLKRCIRIINNRDEIIKRMEENRKYIKRINNN
jgi:hypothetical protein